MMKLIMSVMLMTGVLYSKTLFLDKFDKGEVLLKPSFITSITFENDIKTIFLGDTTNFKAEISADKKILAVWLAGDGSSTNLVVITEKEQFNFILKSSSRSDLFYFIKDKQVISKKEIIARSLLKDRDVIERLSGYKKSNDIKIIFHDKEAFKDTLFLNLRFKISYSGNEKIKILQDEIVLSQQGKIMPTLFKHFDSESGVLTLTVEERFAKQKIRVQVAFKKGDETWVQEVTI